MPEITIDVKDLRALIQELMDHEVGLRCHVAASTRAFSPSARASYANLLDEARPQEDEAVRLRYRGLLEALDSAKDVRQELSRFLGVYA
jgi:hypothetical protein